MGNYAPQMSYRGLVTHNSYSQVASEIGAAPLVCYTMFVVTPLRKLGQIARETFGTKANSHFYYLAVGLQASLIGYMVCSFFASVAYLWYAYYLIGYAVCLRRLYESETGKAVVLEKQPRQSQVNVASVIDGSRGAFEPAVSVIVTAYNEERDLAAKLENTLALDYSLERLEIIVASDCSTD